MIDPTPARAVRSKWRLLSMRGDSTRVIFGYFIFVLDEVESLAVARQSIVVFVLHVFFLFILERQFFFFFFL
jgi:hypothetical protein